MGKEQGSGGRDFFRFSTQAPPARAGRRSELSAPSPLSSPTLPAFHPHQTTLTLTSNKFRARMSATSLSTRGERVVSSGAVASSSAASAANARAPPRRKAAPPDRCVWCAVALQADEEATAAERAATASAAAASGRRAARHIERGGGGGADGGGRGGVRRRVRSRKRGGACRWEHRAVEGRKKRERELFAIRKTFLFRFASIASPRAAPSLPRPCSQTRSSTPLSRVDFFSSSPTRARHRVTRAVISLGFCLHDHVTLVCGARGGEGRSRWQPANEGGVHRARATPAARGPSRLLHRWSARLALTAFLAAATPWPRPRSSPHPRETL